MSFLQNFLNNLDLSSLIDLVLQVAAALICITLHELSHGLCARRLGDPTAKNQGRLTLNPIRHIDPFGLLMMIIAGVGWAKPVPVNPGYFKNPKRGMALTALAGPVCNLLLAIVFLALASGVYHFALPVAASHTAWKVCSYCFLFAARCAILSVGLGLFNLIPIPPLDGSKVLFSFLPDRAYFFLLRYERYVMLALFALVFFGVLDAPLSYCIQHVLSAFCKLTALPTALFGL